MTRLNALQMKSGYDQSLTDSDNMEGFTPTGGNPLTTKTNKAGEVYIFVDGDPEDYSRGQPRTDPTAGYSHVGYKRVDFKLPRIHVDSLAWLQTNYEGMVTAKLRTSGTTYANYNCQLAIPDSSVRKVGINMREAILQFTIIEAL